MSEGQRTRVAIADRKDTIVTCGIEIWHNRGQAAAQRVRFRNDGREIYSIELEGISNKSLLV